MCVRVERERERETETDRDRQTDRQRETQCGKLHINNICSLAHIELCRISSILLFLSIDSIKTLVSAFVLSRLDCCNFQAVVQNSTARLVLIACNGGHVSSLLRTIHWLPLQEHTEYKLSTLCHSFFSDSAPVYLSGLLRAYSPSRQLRSSSGSRTLLIPHVKTKTSGHRSFSCGVPSVYNSWPRDIFDQALY